MLVAEGLRVALASSGLTAYNLGGVLGAADCAIAINHSGSRWLLMLSCFAAAACAFALRYVNVRDDVGALIFGLGVHGFFVNALQTTMVALCALHHGCARNRYGLRARLRSSWGDPQRLRGRNRHYGGRRFCLPDDAQRSHVGCFHRARRGESKSRQSHFSTPKHSRRLRHRPLPVRRYGLRKLRRSLVTGLLFYP
jgi:hypothetical protein